MNQKLKFEQIHKDNRTSFRYGWSVQSYLDEISLHFHPEIEITYIQKGSGYRMAGDFLEAFEEGEVILSPSNQPHCWIYHPESCMPDGNRNCIFVQFSEQLLLNGISFFPEWEYAAHRILSVRQSLKITGKTAKSIINILREMHLQNTGERLLSLFRIIQLTGKSTDLIPIGMQNKALNITKNMQRVQLIYKYVVEHYKEKISLHDIANVVNMSSTAFCTFFKRETGKTFNSFINEYRIEIACNLLMNFPDKEVSEIAWQCGFNDIPYFNRSFRKMKNMTPGQWKKQIRPRH